MKTFVLSAPGREAISWATIANLRRQNPGEPFSVFCAPGRGGIADFWSLLAAAAAAGDDALLLEDDVVTARNFIRFASRWQAPFMTSFFLFGGQQLMEPEDPRAFGGNQALWFPRGLLAQLAATDPPASGRLQDDALGAVLAERGESVLYHRSLVQHVGEASLCRPGHKFMPRAPDFVGEDFDCLTLPGLWEAQ